MNGGDDHFRGVDPAAGTEDGRKPWDWSSRYPSNARRQIRWEAAYLFFCLMVFGLLGATVASLSHSSFDLNIWCRSSNVTTASSTLNDCVSATFPYYWILTYLAGGLGGTIFSIKWLMHAVGTGKWHQDRIYWRIFVPLIGGIYSIVVFGLASLGLVGAKIETAATSQLTTFAVAFLVGYFSDGVSGLLSNVANAVFGTVIEKK